MIIYDGLIENTLEETLDVWSGDKENIVRYTL